MEMNIAGFTAKKLSWAVMAMLAVSVILHLTAYFQAKRQLISLLISNSIVEQISGPYLTMAVIGCTALVVSFALHYFSRYVPAVIIAVAGIILPPVYQELLFF